MKRQFFNRLLSALVIVLTCLTAMAQDFTGKWTGNIQVQTFSIPVVLHIEQNEQGITASLDSPEQQAFGI